MRAGRKPTDKWKQIVRSGGGRDDEGSLATTRIRPALKRLGVTAEELNAAPRIGEILKQADGGMKTVIAAMRFAPDATIAAFLAKYDTLSATDRSDLPVEAVCLAAGIDPRSLLGSVLLALQARSVNLVKMICMSGHPRIAEARLRFGQLPGGDKDRAALDTAMGFLPNPKGPTFIGKAIFGSGTDTMRQQQRFGPDDEDEEEMPITAHESDIDLDKLFPPCNEMQEKLQAIRQRLLPEDREPEPDKDRIDRLFSSLPKLPPS